MLHYYLNLPKGKSFEFEENMRRSGGKLHTAKVFFEPYEAYLNNAIKAMNNKAQIKARWQPLNTENLAELKIVGGLYEMQKQTKIQIEGNEAGRYRILSLVDDPEFDEKLKYKAGDKKGEAEVLEKDFKEGFIRLPIETEIFDKIIWGFNTDIQLEPAWIFFQGGEIVHDENHNEYRIISVDSNCLTLEGDLAEKTKLFYRDKQINYTKISDAKLPGGESVIDENRAKVIYYAEKPIDGAIKIQNKKISEYIKFQEIYLTNGAKLECEHNEGSIITLKNHDDVDKIVISNGIKFCINKIQKTGKDAFWIQLFEIETFDAKDELNGLSPLRCFFDDEVIVVDANSRKGKDQIKYDVEKGGNEEENKIVLKRYNTETRRIEYCFPNTPEISVEVNTHNLEMQLAAISTLKNMPVGEQAKLIQLFENRKQTTWEQAYPDKVNEWVVLKDDNRSGAEQQRDFVKKALGTPDFAILEGPPGSGKTTAILELICQLSKQGKRVLLCGSTHVAIDNILERLIEKKLLESFSILPVRIGDEKRINNDIVKQFMLNELCGDDKDIRNLVLEAATLVCGTTLGILQHPKFKERKQKYNKQTNERAWIDPIVPEFDYLIIDECSKTTFQEFLVPALYAKKWLLIGDVMQLSPFTEQDDIITNLEGLSVGGKIVDRNLQNAVFYLQKLIDCTNERNNKFKNNRFILPVPKVVLKYILDELAHGKADDFYIDLFAFITNDGLSIDDDRFLIKKALGVTQLELSATDIIFIDKELLDTELLEKLPETHAILEYGDWEKKAHSFQHNAFQQNNHNRFNYYERGKNYDNSFAIVENIHRYFFDKQWADEIAWRINSAHQLRLSENNRNRESYIRQYQKFLPKSIEEKKVKEAIDTIAHIAYPSILESLSPRKQLNRGAIDDKDSTISAGFIGEDLIYRKATLEYQHRMHPDISHFPREQFYKSEHALRDLENPVHIRDLRNWDYNCDGRYPTRNVWVHVNGKRIKNYNPEEAEMLVKHLKKFLEYARINKHPEGNQWKVACLAFYRGQETRIREELQKAIPNNERKISRFSYDAGNGNKIEIRLHTVDKFQGDEADIVFLSMREFNRDGFLNNPNRLNVAITRARFQLVIFGNHDYFTNRSQSDDLRALAKSMTRMEGIL